MFCRIRRSGSTTTAGACHTVEVAALLLAEHRRPDDIRLLRQTTTAGFGT
ncbi:hypothetical protein [Streptomyces thermovulgaris]|nr:hypothetical protein [Streptomyces thermovulgaris]